MEIKKEKACYEKEIKESGCEKVALMNHTTDCIIIGGGQLDGNYKISTQKIMDNGEKQ